jgi:hypothetical protein
MKRYFSGDLTILYLTVNKMPDRWSQFQIEHLVKSAAGDPIISISRLPMSLGTNLIQEGPFSYFNIYMQMLRGSLVATTPFVALAEDDVLYTYEHFHEFRPPLTAVSYDRSRWSLFTWDPNPIFCLRQRVNNSTLIAPRELLIEALSEWKTKYPAGRPDDLMGEVGRPIVERRLHVTHRDMVEWYCTNAVVQLNHPTGTDTGSTRREDGRHMVKQHGQIKAIEIPHWGKAADLVRIYDDGRNHPAQV